MRPPHGKGRFFIACDLIRNGASFYCTHPDYNCPTENGFIPDSGAIAALITASTGVLPKYFGKPHKETADMISELFGVPFSETAIVGEDLLKSYLVITCRDTPRIKFQKGAFTIFGLGEEAKKMVNKEDITEIVIDKDAKMQILDDIALMGVDSSTVYPDLERRAFIQRKLKLKADKTNK